MNRRCDVTVHTKSARLREECGPFVYCARPIVPGFNVCRRHLRSKIVAEEKWIAKAKEALGGT